ncbi:energy transducer TonB [Psychroserpens sp.]
MLHYILQVVAFQLGFLIIYDAFLRKETFFNWNRVYLLVTAMLSILIPFIKINQIKTILPEEFVIRLPEVIIGKVTESSSINPEIANLAGITVEPEPISLWNVVLFCGMCIALLILVFKISKLVVLASKHQKHWSNNLLIIKLINSNAAFSFFHYVFLGEQINEKDRSSILEHEMVHVNQKHTLDLLFFEVLRIVFWFNPLVYMYQNRISTLHEYIADAKAVKQQTKAEYYNNLLAQVFETQQFSFVNPFFKQSLIKKRIIMLSKTKSRQVNILKYALLLPLVFTMLVYTSSYSQEKIEVIEEVIQTEDSQLSDKELREKYYNQILEMEKNGLSFMEIHESIMLDPDKYIVSRTDYYKFTAYMEYIFKGSQKSKEENKEVSGFSKSLKSKMNRTYEEYVAWKYTDEAKAIWGNNSRDGVLRLLINGSGKMTDQETKKMNHKLDMIERDPYFKKLIISSLYGNTTMVLEDPKSDTTITADIIVEDVIESIEVPFAVVDQVPTMLTCKDLTTNEERKRCMSKNIALHVNRNFNIDLAKRLGLQGKQRINTIFKIDTNGNVIDVRARAPHPKLEEETIRVINLLPQFKPGKQKGKAVTVPYSLPILFQIKGDSNASIEELKEVVEEQLEKSNHNPELIEVPFSIVDKAPKFKGCEMANNNDEAKKCTTLAVSEFVYANFNTKLASKLGLKDNQRISVIFKIDTKGNVIDVKARAPHPKLEEEAKRVIKMLPQFIPGEHNRKPIIVPYSLPILFQVHPDKKEEKKN